MIQRELIKCTMIPKVLLVAVLHQFVVEVGISCCSGRLETLNDKDERLLYWLGCLDLETVLELNADLFRVHVVDVVRLDDKDLLLQGEFLEFQLHLIVRGGP